MSGSAIAAGARHRAARTARANVVAAERIWLVWRIAARIGVLPRRLDKCPRAN
jgi:hypothetical protein